MSFIIIPGVYIPVSCLCASLSCLPSQPAVFLAPIFPSLCLFLVLLVLTLACPDAEPACLTSLPDLISSLAIPWYCLESDLVYELLPVPDLPFAYTFVIINIRAQPPTSFVCIRVSPCALIALFVVVSFTERILTKTGITVTAVLFVWDLWPWFIEGTDYFSSGVTYLPHTRQFTYMYALCRTEAPH